MAKWEEFPETHEALTKKAPDIHKEPQVNRAVEKARAEGVSIPDKRDVRTRAYLDRLNQHLESGDPRGLRRLANKYLDESVLQLTDEDGEEDAEIMERLAHGLHEFHLKVAQEQGNVAVIEELGGVEDAELVDRYRDEIYDKQRDQRISLRKWTDYLSDPETQYPVWFRYYTLRSLQKLGKYDIEERKFAHRSKTTWYKFPELNQEAYAKVLDILEAQDLKEFLPGSDDEWQDDQEKALTDLESIVEFADFGKLYGHTLHEASKVESAETIDGEWKVFQGVENADELADALDGHGTGWCIAGHSMAYDYLDGGSTFHIYFSYDKQGLPTKPRLSVRLNSYGSLAEVSGIEEGQAPEAVMSDVLSAKLDSVDADEYKQAADDLKRLNSMYHFVHPEFGESDLDKISDEDLDFLFETERQIADLPNQGNERNPRILELQAELGKVWIARKEGISESQIASSYDEISENTRYLYIAPYPDIFAAIADDFGYNARGEEDDAYEERERVVEKIEEFLAHPQLSEDVTFAFLIEFPYHSTVVSAALKRENPSRSYAERLIGMILESSELSSYVEWPDSIPEVYARVLLSTEEGTDIFLGMKKSVLPSDITEKELTNIVKKMSQYALDTIAPRVAEFISKPGFNQELLDSYIKGSDNYSLDALYDSEAMNASVASMILKKSGYISDEHASKFGISEEEVQKIKEEGGELFNLPDDDNNHF